MTYNNNTDKVNFIKKTGAEVIANNYVVNYSGIIDSTEQLSGTLGDADELLVIRKFDHSTISDPHYNHATNPITADETWSVWTLPNSTNSGSSMYNASEGFITFNQTIYNWETTVSGRSSQITVPNIAASDTIYIMRKIPSSSKLVSWTTGAKITSKNLNNSTEQLLSLSQELYTFFKNFHSMSPSVGQPSGICPLDSTGAISNAFITGDSLNLQTENGVTGAGTTASKLTLNLDGDSLVKSSSGVKVDTIDSLISTSITKPLSAAQGKALKDAMTLMGQGIVYKGGVDVNATYALGTASAGWTVTHTGSATGTSHGSGWAIDTTGNGSTDTGNIPTGTVLRYDGAQWDVVQASQNLLADGSVELSANWDAGDLNGISCKTQSNGSSSRAVATTAWVRTHTGAASGNMKLSDIPDVEADSDDTPGNMLVWDSASWEPIKLETVAYDKEILSTGSSISALSNVASTGASTNQALVWNGSAWAPATVSTTGQAATCGGDGNGTTDDTNAVSTAFSLGTLGFSNTTAPDSNTLSTLDFRGRRHSVVSSITTIPNKIGYTVKDGSLEYKENAAVTTMLNQATHTNVSKAITIAAVFGDNYVTLAHEDASVFYVGDTVELLANTVDSNNDVIRTNTVAVRGYDEDPTKGGANRIASHNIREIASIAYNVNDGYVDRVYFTEPLTHNFAATTTTIRRYGTGTDSRNQLKDVTFKNMKFTNTLGRIDYLHDMVNETAGPLTLTNGQNTITLTIRAGHGLAAGDRIRLHDFDLTGKLTIDKSEMINSIHTITVVSGNDITFAMGTTAKESGTFGGRAGWVDYSHHNGLTLQHGSNIVFENCTFKGWNHGHAVKVQRCRKVLFVNCKFIECHASGSVYVTGSEDVTLRDCTWDRCKYGVVEGLYFEANGQSSGNNYYGIRNLTVENCKMFVGVGGLALSHCQNLVVNHSKIEAFAYNPYRSTARSYSTALQPDGFYPRMGIYQQSGNQCTISNSTIGNMIHHDAQTTSDQAGSQGLGSYTQTPFWGKGDGIDWAYASSHFDGQATIPPQRYSIPGFQYAVFASLSQSGFNSAYHNTSTAGFIGEKNSIDNNKIVAYWTGIESRQIWNKDLEVAYGSLGQNKSDNITNNEIVTNYYGVFCREQGPGNLKMRNVGTNVTGNSVKMFHAFAKGPGWAGDALNRINEEGEATDDFGGFSLTAIRFFAGYNLTDNQPGFKFKDLTVNNNNWCGEDFEGSLALPLPRSFGVRFSSANTVAANEPTRAPYIGLQVMNNSGHNSYYHVFSLDYGIWAGMFHGNLFYGSGTGAFVLNQARQFNVLIDMNIEEIGQQF